MSIIKTQKLGKLIKKQPEIREDRTILGLNPRFFNRIYNIEAIFINTSTPEHPGNGGKILKEREH